MQVWWVPYELNGQRVLKIQVYPASWSTGCGDAQTNLFQMELERHVCSMMAFVKNLKSTVADGIEWTIVRNVVATGVTTRSVTNIKLTFRASRLLLIFVHLRSTRVLNWNCRYSVVRWLSTATSDWYINIAHVLPVSSSTDCWCVGCFYDELYPPDRQFLSWLWWWEILGVASQLDQQGVGNPLHGGRFRYRVELEHFNANL